MTFGLTVIGIYVAILGIYCLVVTAILRRINKKHTKNKDDKRGSDNAK